MIQAEIIEWIDPKLKKPEPLGESFLCVLKVGNALGWTHTRPVICEFGVYIGAQVFTAFDSWAHENVNVDEDVLWWAELPEIPD